MRSNGPREARGEHFAATSNPFALLDDDVAAQVAPRKAVSTAPAQPRKRPPSPSPQPPAPAAHRATPPAPERTARAPCTPPKQCAINFCVPYHARTHGQATFQNVRNTRVLGNDILDALLRRRSGATRLNLQPGESFVADTADLGRFEFELIRQNSLQAEIYQYHLHFESKHQDFVRHNVRRVVVTW